MMVLDTHAWLWWVADRPKLSSRARKAIASQREIAISAISCWEVAMLEEKRRLVLRGGARQGIAQALSLSNLEVIPISESIAVEAGLLRDFHGDPADRIIAATARERGATLVTKDPRIHRSKVVHTLW